MTDNNSYGQPGSEKRTYELDKDISLGIFHQVLQIKKFLPIR